MLAKDADGSLHPGPGPWKNFFEHIIYVNGVLDIPAPIKIDTNLPYYEQIYYEQIFNYYLQEYDAKFIYSGDKSSKIVFNDDKKYLVFLLKWS